MSSRAGLFQRPKSTHNNEVTSLFDAVDRWTLAGRFNIGRVHERTRVEIYNAVARGRSCSHFQDVIGELTQTDPNREQLNAKSESPTGQLFVQWSDFTNDVSNPDATDYGSLQPLAHTHRWLRDVIAKHCPFVQPSLNHGRIWMSVARPEETNGDELMQLLGRTRDAFMALSDSDDRNKLLNAMVLLTPDIPKKPLRMSPREYLGQYRQDFGEEQSGTDITVGSFVPAEPVSAIADPLRVAPPVFVFRHSVPRNPHRYLAEHHEDGTRPL